MALGARRAGTDEGSRGYARSDAAIFFVARTLRDRDDDAFGRHVFAALRGWGTVSNVFPMDPVEAANARVGTTLADKYRLERVLGAGGMGTVFAAVNLWTERRVAVKVLHHEISGDPEAVARFQREARTATKIGHPNIVEILDMGQASSDGAIYIVQEYLVGTNLRDLLDRKIKLPVRETFELLVPIMAALVAAHRQGVVHRDLKPENIFRAQGRSGQMLPKLIDFGIAKVHGYESVGPLTRTGALLGTPYYMSPEQAKGLADIDALTDVWAMGVVLFETLSGYAPFEGDNYNALLAQILTAPVPRLDHLEPSHPKALADAIAGALQRERSDRYRSMSAFLNALFKCKALQGEPWFETLRKAQGIAGLDFDDEAPTSVVVSTSSALGALLAKSAASPYAPSSTPVDTLRTPPGFGLASAPLDAEEDDAPTHHLIAEEHIASPSDETTTPHLDSLERFAASDDLLDTRRDGAPVVPPVAQYVANSSTALAQGVAPVTPFSPTAELPAVPLRAPLAPSAHQPPIQFADTRRGHSLRNALFIVGALLLGFAGVWIGTRSTPSTAPAPASPSSSAYRVILRASPAHASIELDGVATGASVLSQEFLRDGRSHRVRVSADGFRERLLAFTDSPPPEQIELEAMPPAPAPPPEPSEAPAPPLVEPDRRPMPSSTPRVAALPERPTRAQIATTFARLGGAVSACGQGRTGTAPAVLTLAGSGTPQTVEVAGPFSIAQRSCMAAVVRRARFPQFRGPSFSISYPFVVGPTSAPRLRDPWGPSAGVPTRGATSYNPATQ